MTKEKSEKQSPAKKFAKLVTEGPEEYRKKYEGLSEEEMAQKMADEMKNREEMKQSRRKMKEDWCNQDFEQRAVKHPNLGARIFWGVLLLIAAAVLGVQAFGLYSFAINPWWLVLGAFLVAFGIATAVGRVWFFTFMSLAGLITIANYQTDWLGFQMTAQQIWWMWGAAVLLSIAFAVLFHRRKTFKVGFFGAELSDEAIEEITDENNVVRVHTIMGETVKYIDSQNLERVILECIMGGQKIYFENAKPSAKGVDVVVKSSLAGIQLYVPRSWKILSGVNSVLGGVEEKGMRTQITDASPIMRLRGQQNLAGIEIIYV